MKGDSVTKITRPTHTRDRSLQRVAAASLACILFVAPSIGAERHSRPLVGPGRNNGTPSAQQGQGLTTQDLDSGLTAVDLVNALLGVGVAVANVQFIGANTAAGTFAGGTGIIGFEGGIVLSTGAIAFVSGPNTQDATTADNGLDGDSDLDGLIPGYETLDAFVLEFDFECNETQFIVFRYVFTSEEYNEYVNSLYNDVFGFFLNGENIALVPGGNGLATSINNLNCSNPYNPPVGSFCNLFVNNDCTDIPPGDFPCNGARNTEMDGLTVVLTAAGTLQPGLNHIKLAVADAGDHVLDSNVFIEGQSFSCGTPVGACCHTDSLTCSDFIAQEACLAPGDVWNVGLLCNQLDPPCTITQDLPGEDCEHAIVINALPFVSVNATCEMDNDYSSTCLGTFDNGDDILYLLNIGSPQTLDITVTGTSLLDNWIGLAVADICPPDETCIAYATTSGTLATISDLSLPAGTYYLMIDNWPSDEECVNFTLSISTGTPSGACCDTGAQQCEDNVLQADCQAPGEDWSVGLGCNQLMPPCAPPPHINGEDCEYPFVVNGLPFADVNTTCGLKEDYSSTCLGDFDDGDDILYELHVAIAQAINITVSGTTVNDNGIGVALGDTCPPGPTCIVEATSSGSLAMINDLALHEGTYYLMIDRLPDVAECMNFTLSISSAPEFELNGFLDCFDGPNSLPACADVSVYDFDLDTHVDLYDFAQFQLLFE